MRPDPSYDMDGDGIVNARDLVLARLFDTNNDGKLDDEERAIAMAIVRAGYEDRMLWGLEASGG